MRSRTADSSSSATSKRSSSRERRWWFKVDPDTVVWRRFRSLPDGACFFGTIQGGSPGPSLQGGCIGGTRAAVAARSSRATPCSRPSCSIPAVVGARQPVLLARARAGSSASTSSTPGPAAGRDPAHRTSPRSVRSGGSRPPILDSYAITHPHKTLDVDAEQRLCRRDVAGLGTLGRADSRRASRRDATVAVVSKGDECPRRLGRRLRGTSRPTRTAAWAGFHPTRQRARDRAARTERVSRRRPLRACPKPGNGGSSFTTVSRATWRRRHRLVAHEPGAGRIWALEEPVMRIAVAGALAAKPGNGGEAWVRLSYLLGLRRLGADVLVRRAGRPRRHPPPLRGSSR